MKKTLDYLEITYHVSQGFKFNINIIIERYPYDFSYNVRMEDENHYDIRDDVPDVDTIIEMFRSFLKEYN